MGRRNRRGKKQTGSATRPPASVQRPQPAHPNRMPELPIIEDPLGAMAPAASDPPSSELDSEHRYSIVLLGALFIFGAALIEQSGAAESRLLAETGRFWVRIATDLLKEFGVALVIAWFMMLTVEKVTRKELLSQHHARLGEIVAHHRKNLREIELNVFRHLLNSILDKTVVDEFLLSMISSHFVRRGLELSYEFDRPPAGVVTRSDHELLRVRVTVQYELHLIAGDYESTPIEHYFESTICEHETFDQFELVEITGCELPPECPPNALLHRYHQYDGIRQGFKVPPVVIKFGVPARVRYRYQVLRRYSDCETYATTVPADGLKVRVAHVDDAVADLAFSLDWNHRIGFDRHRIPLDANTRGSLALNRGFLPNQGFILFWYPSKVLEARNRRAATRNSHPNPVK